MYEPPTGVETVMGYGTTLTSARSEEHAIHPEDQTENDVSLVHHQEAGGEMKELIAYLIKQLPLKNLEHASKNV